MPLDTAAITTELFTSVAIMDGEASDQVQIHTPTLEAAVNIGAALRAAREHKGLSLQDLADATCVRRAYLEAIEEMRVEDLPARPFTIGYIRSIALELGLDPAAAVARFKQDVPERAEPLRAPTGVTRKKDNRLGLILGLGAVVLVTGVGWSIAQRRLNAAAPPPPAVSDSESPSSGAAPLSGETPVSLGAPTAPPAESTIPAPYVTPGLPGADGTTAASTAIGSASPTALQAAASVPNADASPTFAPRGKIYGAPANASTVALIARRPALLVVSAGETVVFAQQLQAGEAYRAPMQGGLLIDVSDPAAYDVYVGGQLHAPLPQTKTPLSQIAGRAAPGAPPAAKPAQG